jgi:hypothetical protein
VGYGMIFRSIYHPSRAQARGTIVRLSRLYSHADEATAIWPH